MRTAFSVFLALALMVLPWGSPVSVMTSSGNEGIGAPVKATGLVKMAEKPMLSAVVGGTTMNWCVAMVGAAMGAAALNIGLALGFAFIWAVTCWSGG